MSTFHSLVVVGCMLANMFAFGWAVYLYLQGRSDLICMDNQPHTYFIQVYGLAYLLIYLALAVVMISVNC